MKRALILSIFLFGWLLLFEACDPCSGGSRQTICVQRSNIRDVAYDIGNGAPLVPGGSLISSDLVIDVIQEITEETCMRHFEGGLLMACSPSPRFGYKFGLEVEAITIFSSASINQAYPAGKDLSPLMETLEIELPVSGEPIVVRYRESSSAFLYYLFTANSIPNGYDPEYESNRSRVIRFKEDVDVAKGEHTFIINWIMSDDSVMSATTTVNIQ